MAKNKFILYKGDDTDAFGQNLLTINIRNIPDGYTVERMEVKIGSLDIIEVDDFTEFPVRINLNSEQTRELSDINTVYIALYDNEGLKKTINKSITFTAKSEVVKND